MTESDVEIEYCQWHPNVETTLHCYQCGTPICAKCARRTPVGYLCPDCLRGRKARYEQAATSTYLIAGGVSVVLGLVASVIPLVGWFVLFLSPLAGVAIAEVVWRLVKRRYGQHLWWVVGAGILVGGLPVLLLIFLPTLLGLLSGEVFRVLPLIWGLLHFPLAIGAASARFRLS